ncbi:MAG: sarcosine oxidase subunit gamma [Hyphomicrobium sp.]
MSNIALAPTSALASSIGAMDAGIVLAERSGLTIALVAARRDHKPALLAAFREHYALDLPPQLSTASAGGIDVVPAGVDQWLVMAAADGGRDLESELRLRLGGTASVSDQSDARVVVRVSGAKARDALAKGLPIDLHPRAFASGQSAITHAAHIGVIVWQPRDLDGFDLACSRSYAVSFWHFLTESAEEFGIRPG